MIQSKKDDLFGAWVAVVVVLPAVSFLIAGGFVFFWQCVKWLESAVWPHLTLRDVLALGGKRWITYRPDSGWLGFDQLRTWLLDDTPLPVFLLMLAGIWFFMTILIMGFVYILIMGFVYKVFVRDP